MKKILLYSLLLCSGAGLTTSCNDFLTEHPEDAIAEDKAIQTLKDVDDYVIGIYSAFKNSALYSGYLTILPDLQSDLVYAINGYSNANGEMYRWDYRSTTPQIEAIYQGLALVVARCNKLFDIESQVQAMVTDEYEQANLDKRLGEVYFARSLAYAEMIKLYCEAYDPQMADQQLGISWITSYRDAKATPRISLKESYANVLADLDKAENLLPEERSLPDSPYFSPAAVKALKARIYLYMSDWDNAIKYSSELIDESDYELSDGTYYTTTSTNGARLSAYDNMWYRDTGSEIIWKIAMSTTDRGGALGSIFLGFNGATYNPDYVPAEWVINAYEYNDTRSRSFFKTVETGFSHALTWPVLNKYPGNPNIDGGPQRLFTNMPKVFRLSEQYLIRAEAYYEKSKTDGMYASKATADLTALRKKRIKGYGSANGSGDYLRDEIRKERVRELFMEGFRLADLKRWKIGFERKPQSQSVSGPDKLKVTPDNVRFTWPIPQHQLDAAMGVVQPNASNNLN
ncbi:MAG: RagB/SusD family nutrient uptake outer membrane protein [Bacteroidales bacterium]